MSDLKSKLPDLKELGAITGKLFKDLKTSVTEIIADYKEKHPECPPTESAAEKKAAKADTEEKKETSETCKK